MSGETVEGVAEACDEVCGVFEACADAEETGGDPAGGGPVEFGVVGEERVGAAEREVSAEAGALADAEPVVDERGEVLIAEREGEETAAACAGAEDFVETVSVAWVPDRVDGWVLIEPLC